MAGYIDDLSNIHLYESEDFARSITLKSGGAIVDLTDVELRFVVELVDDAGEIDQLEIVPIVHPTVSTSRLLVITAEHAKAIGQIARPYILQIVIDDRRKVMMTGSIKSRGFDITND